MKTVTFEKATKKQSMSRKNFGIEMIGKPIANGLICMLFLISAYFMSREQLEKLKIGEGSVVLCFLMVLILSVFYQFLIVKKIKYRYILLISIAELGVYALAVWRFVVHNQTVLERHCHYVFNQVYGLINDYYGVNLLPYKRTGDSATLLVNLTVLSVVFLSQILHQLTGKRLFYVLFPVLVFGFLLGVGEAPGFAGIAIAFVAFILCMLVRRFREDSWVHIPAVAAITVALCVLTNFTFMGKATELSSNMRALKEWSRQIADQIGGLQFGYAKGSYMSNGVVCNSYPDFKGKVVMELTTSEKPQSTIYLRGYWGDTYSRGQWKYVTSYDADEVGISSEMLANQRYASGNGIDGINDSPEEGTYSIHYIDLKQQYTYLPYTAHVTDADFKNFTTSSDYDIMRSSYLASAEVTGLMNDAGTRYVTSYNGKRYLQLPSEMKSEGLIYDAYTDYVYENYLNVPDYLTSLDMVLKYVDPKYHSADDYKLNSFRDDYFKETDNTVYDYYSKQAYTEAAVNYIRDFFSTYYSYNPNLKENGDMDPVDFFLAESGEGFCVHFASAGTLLLRKMGIPARYCSGYVNFDRDFVHDSFYQTYTSTILDSYGHAWCEVYIEQFGWIPVEFTPGYTQSTQRPSSFADSSNKPNLPWENEDTNSEAQVEPEKPVTEDSQTENSQANDTQTNDTQTEASQSTEKPVNETQAKDTQSVNTQTNDSQSTNSQDNKATNKLPKEFFIVSGIILFVILLILGSWYVVRNEKRRRKRRMESLIRSESYNQAAKIINKKVYRDLRKRKLGLKKNLTNDEYAKCLTETYENFDGVNYVRVMSKVVYSNEKLTKEEFESICITEQLKPRTSRTEKASE